MVLLKDKKRTRRMKTIAVSTRTMHWYVIHPILQPNIIEEPVLSLEYNVEEGSIETNLGKNNDKGTAGVDSVVDEWDILDDETSEVETVMDEEDILDKGNTKVENFVDKGDIMDKGTKVVDEGTTMVDESIDEGAKL